MIEKRTMTVIVRDQLRQDIEQGLYTGMMPSMDILASRYGISRLTLRNALLPLRDEGIVDIQQGRGTFIKNSVPELPLIEEEGELSQVYVQALNRYLDFLANPNFSNITKIRMIGIVDSQIQLAVELKGTSSKT